MEVSALKYSGGIGLHGRSPLLRLQSDERLVALTRRGSASAFEVLVARYEVRLLAFCRHMLSSREDAEDVLQEVFASAYNAMLADERPINARPWLYRIARNRCLNHLRKATAIGVDSMDVHFSDNGATTADKVSDREQFRELLGDIQTLPESQRTALVLREMDALSYEQIAEAMETTVPSVKSLLVRARVSLGEASEARLLHCDDVRAELGEVAEGLIKKPSPLVRRHLKSCDRCTAFQTHLKSNNKALAALLPIAPVAWLSKLWLAAHLGHSAGSGAAGGAVAGGAGAAGGGAAAGAGAASAAGAAAGSGAGSIIGGALATKAAAGIAVAALATAGAVEVDHHTGKTHTATNPAVATAVHAGVTMAGASGAAIAQPIGGAQPSSAQPGGSHPGPQGSAAPSSGHHSQTRPAAHPKQANRPEVKTRLESKAVARSKTTAAHAPGETATTASVTAPTPTTPPVKVPARGRRGITIVPTVLPPPRVPRPVVSAPPTPTVTTTPAPTPLPTPTPTVTTPQAPPAPAPTTTTPAPVTTPTTAAAPAPTAPSTTPAPPVVIPAAPVTTTTGPVNTPPPHPGAPAPVKTTTAPVTTTPPPTGTTTQTSPVTTPPPPTGTSTAPVTTTPTTTVTGTTTAPPASQ